MAGTGVGQTLMPHVVRYLLETYGFRGACLLLASLSLHGVITLFNFINVLTKLNNLVFSQIRWER